MGKTSDLSTVKLALRAVLSILAYLLILLLSSEASHLAYPRQDQSRYFESGEKDHGSLAPYPFELIC